MMQTTNHVLMVRPVRFAFNEETAANNAFQQKSGTADGAQVIQRQAVEEFDAYVTLLRREGVVVDVLQDTPEPFTPDSIFPNNCFSTHVDNHGAHTLVLYPMFARNRRLERGKLRPLLDKMTFDRVVDLTDDEKEGRCLEGTGSLILDREHRMAYACLSPRTDEQVLQRWAQAMHYDYFAFSSVDEKGTPVYHTNVVMHVGTRFAIVCMESIRDITQRDRLCSLLAANGKEVVDISLSQMHRFAGNMLELHNDQGEKLLVMSTTARRSLTPQQVLTLEQDLRLVTPDIPAIETAGGGSARCMLAEIF